MVVTTPISEEYMLHVSKFIKAHKSLLDACACKNRDRIPALTRDLEKKRDALLDEKERQGYTDGLSFLENNSFEGFKIVNGRFIGDDVSAYKMGCDFAAGFRKGALGNVYYEVAIFILYNIDLDKARNELYGNKEQGRIRAA